MEKIAGYIGISVFVLAALLYANQALERYQRARDKRLASYHERHPQSAALTREQKRLMVFELLPAYLDGDPLLTPVAPQGRLSEIMVNLQVMYRIQGRDSAVQMIEYLLSGQRSARLDDKLIADRKPLKEIRQTVADILGIDVAKVDRVPSTYAWDLAGAAHLAKHAYWCGFLTEAQLWEYLADTARLADQLGRDWHEYTLSYMLGALIALPENPERLNGARDLYQVTPERLAQNPALASYHRYCFHPEKPDPEQRWQQAAGF